MPVAIDDLLKQIDQKANAVTALFDDADTKNNGDMTDDAMDQVKKLNHEIEDLEKRVSDSGEAAKIRADNLQRVKDGKLPSRSMEHPDEKGQKGLQAYGRRIELGKQFTESQLWKDYFKTIAPSGDVTQNTQVRSPQVLVPFSIKTLITGVADTGAGAFIVPDQSGIYDPLGRRPLMIRDLISIRTTGSDLIEYVRQLTRENNAAPVGEATSSSGSSGVKPEGGMSFERVQVAVKTIAEWVPASKRALSDAGQIRGIIDDELRADLEETLEDQILNGTGTGDEMEGLDSVNGTQDQTWVTDVLTTTRKARTKIRTVGRSIPTAFVMNPEDWETIDLLQDNEARYFYGGPSELGTPRLWGVPVVESEAQPAGFAWLGDWRRLVLWDREAATISVSDAHSDFFIRNLVAILAEMRAACGVIRPSAFIEIDMTP